LFITNLEHHMYLKVHRQLVHPSLNERVRPNLIPLVS
jgi:hypothetical protein